VTQATASTGEAIVSVAPSDTVWAGAVLSDSGRCLGIRLDANATTTYGSWTIGSCTGAYAVGAAVDPSW
jgi:hypothetical protein